MLKCLKFARRFIGTFLGAAFWTAAGLALFAVVFFWIPGLAFSLYIGFIGFGATYLVASSYWCEKSLAHAIAALVGSAAISVILACSGFLIIAGGVALGMVATAFCMLIHLAKNVSTAVA